MRMLVGGGSLTAPPPLSIFFSTYRHGSRGLGERLEPRTRAPQRRRDIPRKRHLSLARKDAASARLATPTPKKHCATSCLQTAMG